MIIEFVNHMNSAEIAYGRNERDLNQSTVIIYR